MSEKDRIRRRKAEAAELGLTLKEWKAKRFELGIVQPTPPKSLKLTGAVKSNLRLSEAAAALSTRAARGSPSQPNHSSSPLPEAAIRGSRRG